MDTILIRVTANNILKAKADALTLLDTFVALPNINGRIHHYPHTNESKILMYFNSDTRVVEFANAQNLESVKLKYDCTKDIFNWVEDILALNLKSFSHIAELNEMSCQAAIITYQIKARFRI
ncbi:TPA: hypothetical protein ACP5VL_001856 [Vibrio parahaemolyticus]|uniref:hypothetical protein n=1 Tax=Vibrio harveyi group TaxID=717610 RepID=UPI0004D6FBB4|nr:MULTISPECIES: hypothetical protein [Vibrio harveyi group]EJC6869249.1 hypothetical protein [Vibrio parahaemolyticus]EJC6978912.1 hypothetical protein [Vibrio parahaemolyticus]EJC7061334.1 hypothetical protein [Vibrio parahaemolyticus]EJC7085275.1 hypothetical protein [Vibrio parahaemolyticus]EJC7162181.1 hypothetical protein [Vibrio parahaemolyticus]